MPENFLAQEYFKLVDIVQQFDQRLLTIKGWGVTLSLAALSLGFQYGHYGLFFVAALSSITFWIIEYAVKRHQIRFYVRMRDIEVHAYELQQQSIPKFTSPQIDWSWANADAVLRGKHSNIDKPPTRIGKRFSYMFIWIMPHVALPHAVTLVVGTLLFLLGISGSLKMSL